MIKQTVTFEVTSYKGFYEDELEEVLNKAFLTFVKGALRYVKIKNIDSEKI